MTTFGGTISTALLLVLLTGTAVAKDAGAILAGKKLAEKFCARCHAVGHVGKSKLPKAPTFKVIANRYSVWSLQESLAEGIVTGHSEMPQFAFSPQDIDKLLTYWDTLTDNKAK